MKKMLFGLLAMSALTVAACSSDGSAGEGEGEGAAEGEGEGIAEGEGDGPAEGEGDGPAEGEGDGGGDVEICDNNVDDDGDFNRDCADSDCVADLVCEPLTVTTDLGDQATPTALDLPVDEVVANTAPAGAECLSFSIPDGEAFLLTAAAENPQCLAGGGPGDVQLFVYEGGVVDRTLAIEQNDDGGEGNCSLLEVILPGGDYVLCVAHFQYGSTFAEPTLPLFPTAITAALTPVTLQGPGGACGATPDVVCDPNPTDYSADGLADELRCIAGECATITSVAADAPCVSADATTQCDPNAEEALSCLSVDDATDFRCVVGVDLELGEPCIPGTTAAVCISPAACNVETSVCSLAFEAACSAATPATMGSNTVVLGAIDNPALACFGFDEAVSYIVYTAAADAILSVESNNGITVGVRSSCTDTSAECFAGDFAVTAGDEVFLAVEGAPGATATVTITETPFETLNDGDTCVIPPNFGVVAGVCDASEGLYCGGVACEVAPELVLDEVIPFSSIADEPNERCYAFTEAGTYTMATTVGCSAGMGDTEVRLLTNGIRVARDDDGGDSLCSLLVATVEEGNHLACVSGLGFNRAITNVEFLVTRE
jgi:hypothetical protein